MNSFAELARIVTKYKSKKKDIIFGDSETAGAKYEELVVQLSENPDLTDEEAEKIVGSPKNSSAFRMFKMRFREKLINSLLLTEYDLITPYAKTHAVLNRNIYCIKMLSLIGARPSAMDLAEQTLKKAIEFEQADIVIECAQGLRDNQKHLGNSSGFKEYSTLVNKYLEIQSAENTATEHFESFIIEHGNSSTFKEEYYKTLPEQINLVEKLKEKFGSYKLTLNYYRLKAGYQFTIRDYKGARKVWDELLKELEKYRHFEYKSRHGEILMNQMHICIYLHDYKGGLDCADKCSAIYKPATANWYLYNELFFLLAVHTRNYQKAGQILQDVTSTSAFRFQLDNTKERWKLFEGYYFILLKAGVAESYENARFRFSSFLNSMTIHSKDKQGYNTSILIAELLYHLLNREFHIITEKMDAVKRYAKRHFGSDENRFRSHIFLKMIIDCEKYGFEKEIVVQKTRKLQQQLQATQFTYISSLDGIEIVPFTDLWNIVLDCMD